MMLDVEVELVVWVLVCICIWVVEGLYYFYRVLLIG